MPATQPPGPAAYWHSRGYLPHFESPGTVQHIAIHLADSLPEESAIRIKAETTHLPPDQRASERRNRADAWIDAGHGGCLLREPELAATVEHALLLFDAQRYRLIAWVVMPNHAHALIEPIAPWTLSKIVASWKSFTGRRISEFRQARGIRLAKEATPNSPVWHREYWDRYIRNEVHLEAVIRYIHENPVKAGLAATPERWLWSSARQGERARPLGAPGSSPAS
jgi:putative transposase